MNLSTHFTVLRGRQKVKFLGLATMAVVGTIVLATVATGGEVTETSTEPVGATPRRQGTTARRSVTVSEHPA